MKIVTLIENLVYQRDLHAEHGLSFYIEAENLKILFDTGQGGNFLHNAKLLGINISDVNYLVISHGHYDHIGGLPYFLEVNSKAKIILKKEALVPKYHNQKFIGLENNKNLPYERFEFIDSVKQLSGTVFIITEIKPHFPEDSHKSDFFTKIDNIFLSDSFEDELFICLKSDDKLTIVSSCSHNGITNIVESVNKFLNLPVKAVIGGFHTKNSTESEINHIAEYFNSNRIEKIGVCHCTGVDNYQLLKHKCNGQTFYNYTGTQITI
jgi:7,8-dihydropterin-6-yl-methyl-4-(beta-D-ribofuranosyl)aminobenzene 5'-phosphate synthase